MTNQKPATCVFPSPSKIPYGGFSPVRLQTGIQPPSSSPGRGLSAARMRAAPRTYRRLQPKHPERAAHPRATRSRIVCIRPKRHTPQQHRAIPSRGPWLPSGLCCPAGSSLTTASSAPLAPFHPLMYSRVALPAHGPASGGEREGPQFTPRFCAVVPSSVPRWIGWLPLAVLHHPHWPSPPLYWLGIHKSTHGRFWRGQCNEAARFASDNRATARRLAGPSPTRAFTFELSPVGSLQAGVEDNYAGKQPIPAAGLPPARNRALWAANRGHRACRSMMT
jgi:hypothetical protein